MSGLSSLSLARTFRRAALPLASYYTVTLVLPLVNGAAGAGAPFTRHALVVLFVPVVMVIVLCAAHAVARAVAFRPPITVLVQSRRRRRGARSPSPLAGRDSR